MSEKSLATLNGKACSLGEAALEIAAYLREHALPIDYIRLDSEKWQVQIKCPDGHKVVIEPTHIGRYMHFDVKFG